MSDRFDLVVVGTGSAGASVANPCRKAGWSVALVDDRPYGGTCANRGCDPKKVLVGAAEVVDWARRMSAHGVRSAGLHIDWPELIRFKRTFTDPVPANREQAFRDAGIRVFHGVARFTAPDAMEVDGAQVTASHFAIAAGAAPARLEIPGENLLLHSDRKVGSHDVLAAMQNRDARAGACGQVREFESDVAAAGEEQVNYQGFASTVFTLPPLAATGLTEEAARAQGLAIDVHFADSAGWYSSRRIAEECSACKVILDRQTGRIVGAHILGTGAEEHINLFALALRHGLTAEQLMAPLYAYPTHGSNTQYMV